MKVLVVDDEVLVGRSLGRALESRGHQVLIAAGGVEGLSIWEEYKPDVTFLDVLMPDLNGPLVIEGLKLKNRGKIILMSAYTGGYDLKKAQSVGADIFLSKPFEDIFQVVQEAERLYDLKK